jgi:hypothetical protein
MSAAGGNTFDTNFPSNASAAEIPTLSSDTVSGAHVMPVTDATQRIKQNRM